MNLKLLAVLVIGLGASQGLLAFTDPADNGPEDSESLEVEDRGPELNRCIDKSKNNREFQDRLEDCNLDVSDVDSRTLSDVQP